MTKECLSTNNYRPNPLPLCISYQFPSVIMTAQLFIGSTLWSTYIKIIFRQSARHIGYKDRHRFVWYCFVNFGQLLYFNACDIVSLLRCRIDKFILQN